MNKSISRSLKGLCKHCGKYPCMCKVPKRWDLPVGIDRRGGKERGPRRSYWARLKGVAGKGKEGKEDEV